MSENHNGEKTCKELLRGEVYVCCTFGYDAYIPWVIVNLAWSWWGVSPPLPFLIQLSCIVGWSWVLFIMLCIFTTAPDSKLLKMQNSQLSFKWQLNMCLDSTIQIFSVNYLDSFKITNIEDGTNPIVPTANSSHLFFLENKMAPLTIPG